MTILKINKIDYGLPSTCKIDIIVGGFLGDEGKGKFVGGIADQYDAVMRVNASTNAGHWVSDGVNQHVTRQLPSIFFPNKTDLVIAPGALLNLNALQDETLTRPDLDELYGKVKVASTVSLVIDPYLIKDRGGLSDKLGSTRQGTGPSAAARAARHALHLYDIHAALYLGRGEQVLEKIRITCKETLPLQFQENSESSEYYYSKVLEDMMNAFQHLEEKLGSFMVDYTEYLFQHLITQNKTILIEGCNGLLLDNLHGMHPYVTSSSTNLGAMLSNANLSSVNVRNIFIVIAAYSTCLGVRPFPTEMDDTTSEHFFLNCNEIDVAEHKKRRIGWLDIPALRKALSGAQGAHIHMNKLDVLTGLSSIKICTHYTLGNERFDFLPDNPYLHDQLQAHYIELPGWEMPITNCETFDVLPENAKNYVQTVQKFFSNKIISLGVGPHNHNLIFISSD